MKKVEEAVRTGDDFLSRTVDASSPPASHSITLPVEPPTAVPVPLPFPASTLSRPSNLERSSKHGVGLRKRSGSFALPTNLLLTAYPGNVEILTLLPQYHGIDESINFVRYVVTHLILM